LCAFVGDTFGIPAVTGMYPENPGADLYKSKAYMIETGKSAAGMKKAVTAMACFSNKLLRGEKIGLPSEEGLIPKGIRVNVFKEKTGAERAVDMLLDKLAGRPFISEVPIPVYKSVTPAKGITDLKKAKIAILTSGGIVPKGNPDRLPAATAKFFKAYRILDIGKLTPEEFESVHAGYDPVYANQNPNRIVPVDLIKELCNKGEIGSLYEKLITTTGNSTSVADATRMGQEIAAILKDEHVDGAILTST
jgi:glycine reductase